MASSNFLDDVLNTEADESAVSALVGSLESQLASSTSASSDAVLIDANHSTNSVNSNSLNASTNHAFRTATAASPAASAASSAAISASASALAGNGHAASSTTIPGTAVLTSTSCNSIPALHTGPAPPAPTTSTPTSTLQQQHINNSVHSLLPNGNPTGLVVSGPQQVANSGTTTLHNGTIQQPTSGTATTMALSGLVIQQPQQKLTGQQQGAQLQPTTMIIPTKVPTALVGQQPPVGANGTAPVIQQQVIRPATQIQQQQQQPQQQTVINSAGGILPSGVQVVNMNAVRGAPGNVQNISTISNSPAHRQLAPRVVLAPQVGARPGQVGITLQTLQGFQAAGAQGHLLVKTESGQYQLLRVGPGVVPGTAMAQPATAPAVPTIQAASAPGTQTVQTIPSAVQNVAGAQIGATYRLQVPVATTVQPVSSAVNTPTVAPQTSVPASAPVSSVPATTTNSGAGSGGGNSGQMTPDTAKVKCKNFLSTLLRLANEQPESVASNVRMLIQGLVDAKVEPEEFTTKLQRELNSSPQPCLIPFLKKSLPFLRHSLATKELTIEGIRPPILTTVSQPSGAVLQTVVTQQQHLQQAQVVSRQVVTVPNQVQATRPLGTGVIRAAAPTAVTAATAATASPRPTKAAATNKATPKQTKTQQQHTPASKVIAGVFKSEAGTGSTTSATDGGPIAYTITLPPGTANAVPTSTISAVPATSSVISTAVTTTSTTSALSTAAAGAAIANKTTPGTPIAGLSAAARASLAASKDKEKKTSNFSSSLVGLSGDDDINDVAAMGGVNLAEESQRILGSTEMIGTQIRSCKDENFLFTGPLTRRVQEIASRHGLGDTSPEVVSLISHATQDRLKTLLAKLAVIAEHRMEVVKTDARYEVHQDVKGQLKFLEELDKLERRRHSEIQREMLLKAAKSRSKAEDPEQAKLKAKAKEMQRAEMEELRQREANLTALQAIGVRKKPRLDLAGTTGSFNQVPLRPRVKRVNVRDLLFLLEEEKATARSPMLYKAYLK